MTKPFNGKGQETAGQRSCPPIGSILCVLFSHVLSVCYWLLFTVILVGWFGYVWIAVIGDNCLGFVPTITIEDK